MVLRDMYHVRILLLTFLMVLPACTSRVAYDPGKSVNPAQDALNINTATADQLEKLPGIGRKTAESIVEFRATNGPFRRVEHLLLIRGVSESRFAELRPYIKTE